MQYRKKPVVVEAYQWFEDMVTDDVTLLEKSHTVGDMTFLGKIKTIEDIEDSFHYVCSGDFILTGVKGEKYACKPDIFNETYEIVE